MSWQDRLKMTTSFEYLNEDEIELLKNNANAYFGEANYENFHKRGVSPSLVIDVPSDGLHIYQISIYSDGVIAVDSEYDVGGYNGTAVYTPTTKEDFDQDLDYVFKTYLKVY